MGIIGSSRRSNSIWDIIGRPNDLGPIDPGLTPDTYGSGDYTPVATNAEESPAYLESAPPAKKGFNWGRAALAFAGGPGVTEAFRRKDALELQQQRYEAQQQQQMQGQLAAFQWAKSHGYSDEDAKALAVDPKTVAAMVQANHAPQKFDSGGGSIYQDGKFTIAPSERQLGRDIIRTDSAGNPNTVFSGVEPVPVQGMGVYGWNNRGPVNPGQGAAPLMPSAGGGMTDEQIAEMERRARGGAAPGPRGFRPY